VTCARCGARWSLACDLQPGGAAAPGVYFLLGAGLAVVAAAGAWFGVPALGPVAWAGAGLALLFAAALLLIAWAGSGFHDAGHGYQGSQCPGCGHHTRIWPWSF
jgi:hypothetical protein